MSENCIFTIIMIITMLAGNSVEQVVPGPDFTAGVKNVTVPEGRLVFIINRISKIFKIIIITMITTIMTIITIITIIKI